MKPLRTKAIVLRRTNYGEADRIVNILTPDHGRLSVMAKGVRREKSKLAGGIELFAVSDVTLVSGKSELWTLTGAKMDTFFAHILSDYDRMQFGYEAIKQVSRATEQLDDSAFYELLQTTLESLNDTAIALDITVSWFWLQLAILLGTGLNLATDINGMKLVEDKNYVFDMENMAFVFHERGEYTTERIKLLRLLSVQTPAVVAKVKGTVKLLKEVRWLAERAVAR
jgi:DNA repair protein RecO (recombination protein O)